MLTDKYFKAGVRECALLRKRFVKVCLISSFMSNSIAKERKGKVRSGSSSCLIKLQCLNEQLN